MDYGALLNSVVFYGMLFGLPMLSVVVYLVLFVHHSDKLQAQFEELKQAAGRQRGRIEAAKLKGRYSDPLFRFRAASAQISAGKPKNIEKEDRIATAIEAGRFLMHDTAIDQLTEGMVLGKTLELEGGKTLEAGAPLGVEALSALQSAGLLSVPILFNPQQ
ncbi:MAG: hypothetical protein V3V10_09045 [Planctomycetota bacterium]